MLHSSLARRNILKYLISGKSYFYSYMCFTARHIEINMQVSTAKTQADSAKLELTNYKEKATRILQVWDTTNM